MRQQRYGTGGGSSAGMAGPREVGSVGKRTLVQEVYGQGAIAPVQRQADSAAQSVSTPRTAATGTGDPRARVAELAASGVDAATLRRMVSAEPTLADAILSYLATEDDGNLNAPTTAAFPPADEPNTKIADGEHVSDGDDDWLDLLLGGLPRIAAGRSL